MENQIKLVAMSVYDSAVKQHTSPQMFRTIEEGLRSFGAGAVQEGHDFKTFSKDYTFWKVGYFYPQTGIMESCDKIQVASASDYAVKPKQ